MSGSRAVYVGCLYRPASTQGSGVRLSQHTAPCQTLQTDNKPASKQTLSRAHSLPLSTRGLPAFSSHIAPLNLPCFQLCRRPQSNSSEQDDGEFPEVQLSSLAFWESCLSHLILSLHWSPVWCIPNAASFFAVSWYAGSFLELLCKLNSLLRLAPAIHQNLAVSPLHPGSRALERWPLQTQNHWWWVGPPFGEAGPQICPFLPPPHRG